MPTRFLTILCVAVFAWALLFAGIAAAQEDTTEETTALSAALADRKVEAKTDNVSVEVDNGKVSVSTGNGSSSGNTTSQQSSLTVQQNQADEGSGSRVSTGDENIIQSSSSSCQNQTQVASLDEDGDGSDTFSTQGKKFRVSYSVDFPTNANNPQFTISIKNSSGTKVVNDVVKTKDVSSASFIVNRRADNYDLQAKGKPANGTTFDVTVDDCRGTDGRGGQGGDGQGGDGNRGAADKQYGKAEVIVKTIPDKGRLAATGGVPLVGVAFLALASVGLGLSILRFAIRRGP